jgi:hypothetical protein
MTPVLNLRFRFFIRAVLTQTRLHSCKKPLDVRTMADDRVHSGGVGRDLIRAGYWCRLSISPQTSRRNAQRGFPGGGMLGSEWSEVTPAYDCW